MTAHRSHHPEAALARDRSPDPAAEPERCLSAAAGGESSAVGDRAVFAMLGFLWLDHARGGGGGGQKEASRGLTRRKRERVKGSRRRRGEGGSVRGCHYCRDVS
jgi:hypothetical protein